MIFKIGDRVVFNVPEHAEYGDGGVISRFGKEEGTDVYWVRWDNGKELYVMPQEIRLENDSNPWTAWGNVLFLQKPKSSEEVKKELTEQLAIEYLKNLGYTISK